MKRTIITLLFAGIAGCAPTPPTSPISSDALPRERLLGSWVCDPSDQQCTPHKTTYRADGTAEFYAFSDKGCDRITNKTIATWRIDSGRLLIVVQQSEGTWAFDPGYISDDKIVAISEAKMTLEGLDGYSQLRLRSERCI